MDHVYFNEINNIELPTEEVTEVADENISRKLMPEVIKYMLELRCEDKDKFSNPKTKVKINLWDTISKEVNRKFSLNLTKEYCDKSFRNLLRTYKSHKLKGSTSWMYYKYFEDIFGDSLIIAPPKTAPSSITDKSNSFLSSLSDANECSAEESSPTAGSSRISSPNRNNDVSNHLLTSDFKKDSHSPPAKKRKRDIIELLEQMQESKEKHREYCIKRDEERFQQQLEMEKKRIEIEEKRLMIEKEKVGVIKDFILYFILKNK